MRKVFLAILVAVTMITATAFSVKSNQQKANFSQYWYQLITNGDPANYLDYERVGSQPCNGASSNVCGVYAEQFSSSDIEHPNLGQVATTVYKP